MVPILLFLALVLLLVATFGGSAPRFHFGWAGLALIVLAALWPYLAPLFG